jgi:YDG domain
MAALAASKVYDGSTSVSNVTVGPVTGLAFTSGSNLSAASPTKASFDDKNAGTGKTVVANGFTITGYNGTASSMLKISSSALQVTTKADITQAPLIVTANNDSKVEGTPYGGGNGVSFTGFVAVVAPKVTLCQRQLLHLRRRHSRRKQRRKLRFRSRT